MVRGDIINFAVKKLTCEAVDKIPGDEAALATIGIRLVLEFEPGREMFPIWVAQMENTFRPGSNS